MPKITKIETQKNNAERFNVFLDGKFAFPISSDGILEFRLKVNEEASDEKIKDILNFEQYDKVLQKLLGFISYRPRSRKEIDRKIFEVLRKIEVSEELKENIIERVKTKLTDLSLYKDDDFAALYVESSKNRPIPLGSNKIRIFLSSKGVSADAISMLLQDYLEYEIIGATAEFSKKSRKYNHAKGMSYKDKAAMTKYLSGKGYSWEAINTVFDSNFEL